MAPTPPAVQAAADRKTKRAHSRPSGTAGGAENRAWSHLLNILISYHSLPKKTRAEPRTDSFFEEKAVFAGFRQFFTEISAEIRHDFRVDKTDEKIYNAK